ncbi:hypothetical protein D6D00_09195 [Aureobasidium pullulans]|nr:hypothetical protein D6D00_09195 [Aureobasidium pullulans]
MPAIRSLTNTLRTRIQHAHLHTTRPAFHTPPPKIDVEALLATPTWSLDSLLPPSTPSTSTPTISSKQLHHLLRLSALPPPEDAAEEAKMLSSLSSHLHFVNEIRKVHVSGLTPLQSLRDETAAGIEMQEIGMKDLEDAFKKEEVKGTYYTRIRRDQDRVEEGESVKTWDVLGAARKKPFDWLHCPSASAASSITLARDIPYSPLMSSPIVCAGDILVTLYYWTRYGFTDLRFRRASRLLIADMHIAKAELVFGQKDLLQHTIWTPAVLSVRANLMMAVPQLKIVGFTGLPWFCYTAAASFMLAAIVRLLLCWAATCSLSESQQHSLTDLHDNGALQTRSRVVDQIFRYCIFFQMSVWVALCLPDNAILVSIILTVLPYVLGVLFCFAAWYAKSKRPQQFSAQNQKRKQRCDQQLKNNKITFAEYQQRARWQWYSSPDKVPPIEKGQKNLKGWVGKAKIKEKDSGKSEGQQKVVEDDAEIAGGDDN